MSLQDYKLPLILHWNQVWDSANRFVFGTESECLSSQLCSILNAHFAGTSSTPVNLISPEPKPDIDETNRVAAEWYKSGRKLKVEFWNKHQRHWQSTRNPNFTEENPWRIAPPEKEHQVLDVFRHKNHPVVNDLRVDRSQRGVHLLYAESPDWKLVGTLQGEVEK